MMGRRLAIALAIAVVAGVAQARTAPLVEPERVLLPAAQGQTRGIEGVRAAIIAGSQSLGWSVVEDARGRLTLKYNKQGKHEVVIDALYDDQGYELKYRGSTNMNYRNEGSGVEIHPNYNRWIINLIKHVGAAAR